MNLEMSCCRCSVASSHVSSAMGIWKRASTLSSMLCIVTSMRVHVVKHDVVGIQCSHIPFIKLVGTSATLASVASSLGVIIVTRF